MKTNKRHGGAWLVFGFCLALLFPLSAGVVEAKKDKAGGKCEGTKKERKQKMEKREITDEQFQTMIDQYKQEVSADFDQMKQTVIRRLERKFEASRTTGQPFVYDILIVSGGGAKGAFVDDSPPERAGDIAAEVDLPRPVTTEIIEALVRCGMLERSARPEEALRPGSDLGQGRLGDLLLAYRHTGKINSGSLGGFLDKEVGAYHESLEAALRRAGSLDLAALASRPSLISPSFPP